MSTNNSMVMIGNLVDDVKLRYTNTSNKPVVNGRIAVNEPVRIGNDWSERTTYLNFVAWDAMAEHVAASVNKGDRVVVSGRLQTREYTPENGVRQYFTELVADEVAVSLRWAIARPDKTTGRDLVPASVSAADVDAVYGEPF
jgi:single-strand DNA-binding protein